MVVFRVGQLAAEIGVHRNTVGNWIKKGLLDATPVAGRRYCIDLDEFKAFCQKNHIDVDQITLTSAPGSQMAPPVRVMKSELSTAANEVNMSDKPIGSVMVVGGGIAGMQAALDLADSGYYVYMIEKSAGIGGVMAQLDKTFPTNDCAM